MTGLEIKPIVVGVLVDIVGSTVIGVVAFIATASVDSLSEPVDLAAQLGTFGLALLAVVGLAQTGLGGFVAAHMASLNHFWHGVAVGVISLIFAILVSQLDAGYSMPMWYDLAGFLGVVPAAALGGYLAAPRKP
jgi:hypothetical protein